MKKNNEMLAVPSSQPRGDICDHGAPIQKRKKKLREKERKYSKNTFRKHPKTHIISKYPDFCHFQAF